MTQRKSQTILNIESILTDLGMTLKERLAQIDITVSNIRTKYLSDKLSTVLLAEIRATDKQFNFSLKRTLMDSKVEALLNGKDIFFGKETRMNLLFMNRIENIQKIIDGILEIMSSEKQTPPSSRRSEDELPPVRGRSAVLRDRENGARRGAPDTKQFLLVLLRLLDIVANSEEGQRLFVEQDGLFEAIKELIVRQLT